MNQITKYTKAFTQIGILGTIVGYLFLLYWGNALNEEISDKKIKLNNLNLEISEREKSIKEIQKEYEIVNLKLKYGLSISNTNSPESQKLIKNSDSADVLINEFLSKYQSDTSVIISYYSKTEESEKITLSLKSLSYNLISKNPNNLMKNQKTNSIWFGRGVKIIDVKIIALTLIRAGIAIKSIRPFRNSAINPSYKKNIIEIGGDRLIEESGAHPLTIKEVKDAIEFQRN